MPQLLWPLQGMDNLQLANTAYRWKPDLSKANLPIGTFTLPPTNMATDTEQPQKENHVPGSPAGAMSREGNWFSSFGAFGGRSSFGDLLVAGTKMEVLTLEASVEAVAGAESSLGHGSQRALRRQARRLRGKGPPGPQHGLRRRPSSRGDLRGRVPHPDRGRRGGRRVWLAPRGSNGQRHQVESCFRKIGSRRNRRGPDSL